MHIPISAPLFLSCIALISSIGLIEEFTWTRFNFLWPQGTDFASRFGYGSDRGRFQRPLYANNGKALVFQGATNAIASNTPLATGGNRENQGHLNQISKLSGSGVSSEINPGSIDYQYVNNVPMGANVWQDKLFITIPRRRLGVPSTLNYIPLNSKERHNVPLIPYPNWNINLYPDTSGKLDNFVSFYRISVDVCDRLWLVDTGLLELPGNRTIIKPHEVVIINLQNDQVVHRFNLPDNVVTPVTALASVTADATKNSCDNAYAYFPDYTGYALIVYSLKENRAWKVNNNYFFMEPLAGDFFISGHRFQWNDGVFSVELSDIKPDGFRDMYFHSMAGTHMYRVSTRVIRNETLATRSYHGADFEVIGDRGPSSQTSAADIHKSSGIMFLGLVNQNALGCWNINNNLKSLSIVQKDDEKMIYPSDVKISGDRVYVFTTTMPEFLYGMLDYDKINFRVWSNDVRSAIKGTMCERRTAGA